MTIIKNTEEAYYRIDSNNNITYQEDDKLLLMTIVADGRQSQWKLTAREAIELGDYLKRTFG